MNLGDALIQPTRPMMGLVAKPEKVALAFFRADEHHEHADLPNAQPSRSRDWKALMLGPINKHDFSVPAEKA